MAENPYVGPRPFKRGETLYGRSTEALELQDLVVAGRIVMLYSPSGAGKTSLLEAALVPRLVKKRFKVLPTIRVHREAAGSVNRYVLSTLLSLEEPLPKKEQLPVEELAGLDLAGYLERCSNGDARKTLLIFDQFEEVLTLDPTDAKVKELFFAQLGDILDDRRRFAIFSLREDYVGALEPYLRPLPGGLSTRFRLDLLRRERAMEAMQEPAKPHVDFTDDAAAELARNLSVVRFQTQSGMREVQGQFIEPVVLQVVCEKLWDRVRPDPAKIDAADIRGVGDVDQALADYYGEKAAWVAKETVVSERAIRDWCGQVLITKQGIRSQVLETPESSQGLANSAIKALDRAHLVRAENRRGEHWYELAHDRLIEPVRRSNAEWWSKQAPLFRAARRWEESGGDRSYLYNGDQLEEILKTIELESAEPSMRRFLEHCRAAEEERKDKEREARRRERFVTLLAFATGGVVALTLLVGIVLLIYVQVFDLEKSETSVIVLLSGVLCFLAGGSLGWGVLLMVRLRNNLTQWLRRLTRKHRMDRSLQGTAESTGDVTPAAGERKEADLEPWEIRTLQFAPFWAYLAVAGVDGAFTAGEANAFLRGLRLAARQSPDRIRKLFAQISRHREVVVNEFIEDPRDALQGLHDAAMVLMTKTTEEEAASFKGEVIKIGGKVASKGWSKLGDDRQKREAALEFVTGVLEGTSGGSAAAVQTRHYRHSGIVNVAGIFKSAALITVAALVVTVLHILVQRWIPFVEGAEKFTFLGKFFVALIFGGILGVFTDTWIKANHVRSAMAVYLLAIWAGVISTGFTYLMVPKPAAGDENAELLWGSMFVFAPALSLMAIFMGRLSVHSTYCEVCGEWCKEQEKVVLLKPATIEKLRTRLIEGNIDALGKLAVAPAFAQVEAEWLQLSLHSCEKCGKYQAVTVKRRVTVTEHRWPLLLRIVTYQWGPKRELSEKTVIDRLLITRAAAAAIRELGERTSRL